MFRKPSLRIMVRKIMDSSSCRTNFCCAVKPSLRWLRTFWKSSIKPMSPKATATR